MLKKVARRAVVAGLVFIGLSVGCGSSGAGCAGCGLKPLPKDANGVPSPAPFGIPSDQLVEGGIQARITNPGFDKLLSIIPSLIGSLTGSGICIGKNSITGGPLLGINYCGANDCAGGPQGCPAYVFLKSGDRPSS